MRPTLLTMLAILFVASQAVTRSQSGTPQLSAVDVTNADIRATIKTAPADAVMDQQIRVVNINGDLADALHYNKTRPWIK